MIAFLTDLERSGQPGKTGSPWPRLVPATVSGLEIKDIWDSGAVMALLMVESVNSTLGSEVMLDTSQVI